MCSSSSTPRVPPASRRVPCSRTRTASGRTFRSTASAGVQHDDVVLQVLPQFHVGGWNVQPLLAWWKGATVVLEESFDAGRTLRLIAEQRVTTMMGVPATYLFLAQEPGFAEADLSSLRLAVVGGAPMPEALLETWHDRGVDIVQGYGLTEAAPNVLCLPPEDARRKLGFAGKPYPHVDVGLRDAESGTLLEGPATGELVVRGPERLRRLLARPGGDRRRCFATVGSRRATSPSGTREGFYRIAGRLKELVISGGENVYPAELEDVLHDHPAVAEAAVIGVPDERWGEACAAFVVLRPGTTATADELRGHCRRATRPVQGAPLDHLRRGAPALVPRQGVEGRPARRDHRDGLVSETLTGVDGRPLSSRGERTRRRLLEAAETVFAELGYHDASIVKLTETAGVGQGTFYLYFASKKEIFDELVVDLNHRVRHAMTDAASQGKTRAEMERLGFEAFFRFTAEHPALYRIIRQAEFVSPEILQLHYERLTSGYVTGLRAGDGGRSDRAGRPRAPGVGADGDRRARRDALDPLGGPGRAAARGARRARADRRAHDRLPERQHVSPVGLVATAHYLPERFMSAAEVGAASGISESVIVEKFGLRGKHVAAEDEHVSDLAVEAGRRLLDEHGIRSGDRSERSSTTARPGRTTRCGRSRRGSHTDSAARMRTRSSTTTSRWVRRSRSASRARS